VPLNEEGAPIPPAAPTPSLGLSLRFSPSLGIPSSHSPVIPPHTHPRCPSKQQSHGAAELQGGKNPVTKGEQRPVSRGSNYFNLLHNTQMFVAAPRGGQKGEEGCHILGLRWLLGCTLFR